MTRLALFPHGVACLFSIAFLAIATEMADGQSVEEFDAELPAVQTSAPHERPLVDTTQASAAIVERTNEFRKKQELPPVGVDPQLTKAAKYFAGFMARTGKYGHRADGNRPSQRAKENGYAYCIVLENIAYAYRSNGFQRKELVQQFVNGWKESKGHRENMLDPDVTETGVAIAADEDGQYFAVQMFGRPEDKTITFEVTNKASQIVQYSVLRRNGDRDFPLPPLTTRSHSICRPSQLGLSSADQDELMQIRDGQKFVVRADNGEAPTLIAVDGQTKND